MVIGLAGKSCSGKNEVGELLKARSMMVLDLDVMAHDVLDRRSDAVSDAFGPGFVRDDGTVDRKKLGKVVFGNMDLLAKLECITYGALREEIDSMVSSANGDIVINGALLHRAGLDSICSCLVYVDAPYAVREARALKRDGATPESFARREASQGDVDFRTVRYRCPVIVFDNSANDQIVGRMDDLCGKIDAYRRRP